MALLERPSLPFRFPQQQHLAAFSLNARHRMGTHRDVRCPSTSTKGVSKSRQSKYRRNRRMVNGCTLGEEQEVSCKRPLHVLYHLEKTDYETYYTRAIFFNDLEVKVLCRSNKRTIPQLETLDRTRSKNKRGLPALASLYSYIQDVVGQCVFLSVSL